MFAAIAAALLGSSGCSKPDAPETSPVPAPVASAAVPAGAASRIPTEARLSHKPPSGPILAIQPGKAVGAIFLGATTQTIERQMDLPCDEKNENVCRYFDRAVEFYLENGKLARIHVERVDRPAGKDATGEPRKYGVFHGAIPPDIKLGMLPWAVHQYLGKPLGVDKVTDGGENHTVAVEHYTGMDLEFDELAPGRLVLGGVWIPGAPPKKK